MINHFKGDFRNKYETKEKIGIGNYTDVYKAKNKVTKELRAIKVIKLFDYRIALSNENSMEEINQILNDFKEKLTNEIKNMKKTMPRK